MKNYYRILGINISAQVEEIKRAYRDLAKKFHPDLNRNNPDAASKLADVNEAYGVLSDEQKRAEYNKRLNAALAAKDNPASAQRPQFNQFQARAQRPPIPDPFQTVSGSRLEEALKARVQLENDLKKAYNDGYAKGYNDAQVRADAAAAVLKKENGELAAKVTDYASKVSVLKKELAEADSDFAEQAEKIAAMIAERPVKEETQTAVTEGEGKNTEALQFELNVAKAHAERNKDKLRDAEKELTEKKDKIESLNKEINRLKDKITSFEEYFQEENKARGIEQTMMDRAMKLKEEKKFLKNTHYGTLGAMFWADNNELESNYLKLKKRLAAKAASKGDVGIKLDALEHAYSVLSDENSRTEYNLTLGIKEEDIEEERALEKEYNELIGQEDDGFEEYFDELNILAKSGDAEAQNALGEMYYWGEEVQKDTDKAFHWFKEAAMQQHPAALYNLGQCFLAGSGTDKNEAKAMTLIRQSAKLGFLDAAEFLK